MVTRAEKISEVVGPQIHTQMATAIGRAPSPQDDIAAHVNRLRIDLANTGDLAAKITGTPPPTSVEEGGNDCPLDRIDSLLDDCDMHARNLRLQLDKIYNRLTGG